MRMLNHILSVVSFVYLRTWIIQRNGNDYFPIIRCGELL